MTRLVFTIIGNKVQNVGYRLFLLSAMKEIGLVGFATNLASGKQVSIEVWGKQSSLDNFYNYVCTKKPSRIGMVNVGQKIIDNEKQPKDSKFMNEKLDLMIEQMGKFVQSGKSIEKALKEMPNAIGEKLVAIVKPAGS